MKKSGTLTRVVTGTILIVLLAACVWLGPVTRMCFFYAMLWFAAREMSEALNALGMKASPWIARVLGLVLCVLFFFRDRLQYETAFCLCAVSFVVMLGLLAALFNKAALRDVLGSFVVCFYPCMLLLGFCYLAMQDDATMFYPVFFITLFAASGCDTFAYFCGRAFGRHKLCPTISPNKTVEGAVFGTVFGTALGLVPWLILKDVTPIPWYVYLIASFLCTLFGQFGDLCASLIKRRAGIKDFSDLLPGHGGVIDRADSFCFALPVAFFTLIVFHAL
jgi:phosphatidate cytidylyltransferase